MKKISTLVSKLRRRQVSPTKGILPKNCSECVEALMDCWEGNYCFRDDEKLTGSAVRMCYNGQDC